MSTVYRIAKFEEVFTKRDGRKSNVLHWVSVPTGFQSNGYQSLVEDFGDEAPAIYGAWCALVAVAARCPTPGVLSTSRGRPITPERAANMAYMPAEPFRKLYAWASSESVGWIEVETQDEEPAKVIRTESDDHPEGHPDKSRRSSGLQDRTLQDRTEQDAVASATCSEPASLVTLPDDPVVMEFPTNGKGSKVYRLTASKVAEYVEAFPGVDVDGQLLKARQWCRDNPTKRKTPQGMPAFLARWLGKQQNAGDPISRGSPQKPPPRSMSSEKLLAILEGHDP